MRKTLLTIAAASGLAATVGAQPGLAQTAAPHGEQMKHAESPDSGKAKSTPDTTQIPGSSTTGNATGPAGSSGPAQGHVAGTGAGTAGNRTVPSPAQ
jgi:hypothetical protein